MPKYTQKQAEQAVQHLRFILGVDEVEDDGGPVEYNLHYADAEGEEHFTPFEDAFRSAYRFLDSLGD